MVGNKGEKLILLNLEKIKLMTKLSLYEEGAKQTFAVQKFFKPDFVLYHLLKSAFYFTINFVLITIGALIYFMEVSPWELASWSIWRILGSIVLFYVIMIIPYLVIAYWIYSLRYDAHKEKLKIYQSNLKRLNHMYELSDKGLDTKKED